MARGRRLTRAKLKPLEPAVEAKYLLSWPSNELRLHPERFFKLNSQNLFGNDHPLEVEIGAGTGSYIAALAERNPQTNYLAVEVSRRRAIMAAGLAGELGLENLRVLWANFKLLGDALPAGGWQRAYLHFPDPVHKRADEKRNIFDAAFLDAAATALKPGGELSVVSDHLEFFTRMLELVEGDARFAKAHAPRYLEGFDPEIKSQFQVMWERKGVVPRRFVVTRLGQAT